MNETASFSSISLFFEIHSYDFKQRACQTLSKSERKTVRVVRIAFTIGSFGTLPLISYLAWGSKRMATMIDLYREAITRTALNHIPPTNDTIRESSSKACNRILNGLYLGNSEAFVRTTHLPCYEYPLSRPVCLDTSNPKQFQSVVTLCPLRNIARDYPELPTECIQESFNTHHISWHYLGKNLHDHEEEWSTLTHDSTFPDSPLANAEPLSEDDLLQIQNAKRAAIENMAIDVLFEPTFKKFDMAVFSGRKFLVHCQGGRSRSPALVAAYLINRFQVTAEQALAFLSEKRPCIRSEFEQKLNEYENDLQFERLKQQL